MIVRIAILLAVMLGFSQPARAQDTCTAPPAIDTLGTCSGTNLRIEGGVCVCDVPVGGGTCTFSSNTDGVVDFPDNDAVTGEVDIAGGIDLHIGGDVDAGGKLGGYMLYAAPVGQTGNRSGLHMTAGDGGTKYLEGLHIDVNGHCDQFSFGSQTVADTTFTFVNNYTRGGGYNIIDGNCHGDVIQAQSASSTVVLTINLENFAALMENFGGGNASQGIFTPNKTAQDYFSNYTNVYLRREVGNGKPVYWWDNGTDSPHYVTLDNVWSESDESDLHPPGGIESGGQVTWPPADNITGFVSLGTATDPVDLAYPGKTGLSYDRSFFCEASEIPHSHSELMTRDEMLTWCVKRFNTQRCAEFQ